MDEIRPADTVGADITSLSTSAVTLSNTNTKTVPQRHEDISVSHTLSKPLALCKEDVKAAETVEPKKQHVTLPLESNELPQLQPPSTESSDGTAAERREPGTPNDNQPKQVNSQEVSLSGQGVKSEVSASSNVKPTEKAVLPHPSAPLAETPKASAVLDGTKLILRLLRYQNFQVDQPLRIIFSSRPLRRIERSLNFVTYASDAPLTTVVIDTGLASHHFIPIVPALHSGVIYTRDAVAHVVVAGAGDLKRMKITSKALPYKVCNKFIATSSFVAPARKQMTDPYNKSSITLPWISNISGVSPQHAAGGIIFLRVDDSIFRYQLGKHVAAGIESELEEIELQDGRLVAWSAGVEFRSSVSMWCYRRVQGATGRGAIWLDNPRQSTTPAGPPAAFAG